MVSRNNTILAAQFNTLQNRIAQLLGNGFSDFGYGQPVSSSLINPPSDAGEADADNITVEDINNLRRDLAKIYKHQTGSDIPISEFTSNDIIGADQSATAVTATDDPADPDGFVYTYENSDPLKGLNDIISLVRTAEADRFIIAPGQYELQSALIDQRDTNWNDVISSEFTISFEDEDSRRHFFNSGGEIRFEGTVEITTSEGDSLTRDQGWQDMLQNVGIVRFGYNSVLQESSASSNGVTFPDGVIGNYDLTNNYRVVFRKNANSGDYSESFWQIEAKENFSNQIQFKVTLRDEYDENTVEPITADLQFEYSYKRANKQIIAPIPAFNQINPFE